MGLAAVLAWVAPSRTVRAMPLVLTTGAFDMAICGNRAQADEWPHCPSESTSAGIAAVSNDHNSEMVFEASYRPQWALE